MTAENKLLDDQILSKRRGQWYTAKFTLPVERGNADEKDIVIGERDFYSRIVLWDQTYPTAQNPEGQPQINPVLINFRDGLFTVQFSTGSRQYQNAAALIRAVFGDPVAGRPMPFAEPLLHCEKEVIRIRLVNQIDRTGVSADDRTVYLTFHGGLLFPGEVVPGDIVR